jgi:hypothetical protein
MEYSKDQKHFLKKNRQIEEDLLTRLKESKMQTIISVQSKGNEAGKDISLCICLIFRFSTLG